MWTLFLPGTILLLVGLAGVVFPPRKVNWWYGYRTPRSMRSQECWEDANRLAVLLLVLVGFLSLNAGLTCWYFSKRLEVAFAIVSTVTAVLGLTIMVVVEIYLSRTYDRQGRPRSGDRIR